MCSGDGMVQKTPQSLVRKRMHTTIGYSAKLENGDFLVGESDNILVVASKERFAEALGERSMQYVFQEMKPKDIDSFLQKGYSFAFDREAYAKFYPLFRKTLPDLTEPHLFPPSVSANPTEGEIQFVSVERSF